MSKRVSTLRSVLCGSCAAIACALVAGPAFAQAVPQESPATQSGASTPNVAVDADAASEEMIVVTGSLIRCADTITASPVTVLSTADLDRRAVTTVQEGLQQLTSNNGPALTNSFSANGAFGAGASPVSLRGLTTSSTLVLFDGMRAAYIPCQMTVPATSSI